MQIPQNLTNEKAVLVHVMAWWQQGTSNNLSQSCPDIFHHMSSLEHNELNSGDKATK